MKDSFSDAAARVSRAVPPVVLGTLLNLLDAASTGLLLFPSAQQGPAFAGLQIQAVSLYLMSTVISQLTMSLGGSLFPGALGSMLIEVLPFLRGIASDVQGALGPESPQLLPTVIAAYAMTSFSIGVIFMALGLFRLGWIVSYFPQTVLTGVLGAIGVSLFLLSLELTLPSTSAPLTLSSSREVLFNSEHLPLLIASLLPAIFLCTSLRLKKLSHVTKGFTEHAMYVPIFVLSVATIFWIVVAGTGQANSLGMARLSNIGWLFTIESSALQSSNNVSTQWNYWSLFNFSLVHWPALKPAINNICLTVLIGVLNLPVYMPAMANMLGVSDFNMDWEFIGHGISNILSGAVGSVPNLVVLSNSRMFTFAGGERIEALVVTGFTFILFFVSGWLLPYIPTILASTLVLFLGIELMVDAVWCSAEQLLWCEWMVVMATLLSCVFVGFLPGFGIGLGVALLIHCGWDLFGSCAEARVLECSPVRQQSNYEKCSYHDDEEAPVLVEHTYQLSTESTETLQNHTGTTTSTILKKQLCQTSSGKVTIVSLSGNVFFGTLPSLTKRIDAAMSSHTTSMVIVDMIAVQRCETCVGELISRKVARNRVEHHIPFVLAGVSPGSPLHADLVRGGLHCRWYNGFHFEQPEVGMIVFNGVQEALTAQTTRSSTSVSEDEVLGRFEQFLSTQNKRRSWSTAELKELGTTVRRLDEGEVFGAMQTSLTVVMAGLIATKSPPANHSHGIRSHDPKTDKAHRMPLLSAAKLVLESAFVSFWEKIQHTSMPQVKSVEQVEANGLQEIGDYALNPDWTVYACGDAFGFDKASEKEGKSMVVVEGPCWLVSSPGDREDVGLEMMQDLRDSRSWM